MLELVNVKKTYKTKSGDVNALDGVSLTFPETGMVFITGKSGCGKTTLLNVIGGLDGFDDGELYVQDKAFSSFKQTDFDNYRNTFIGFIFQEYNLLNEFSVEKNIELALELQGDKVDKDYLKHLTELVEIGDLMKRKPSELSGGQRQRVAIARALIKNPRIIMADEPTGALDSNTGKQVFDILKKLSKEKLVIIVSHDQDFAEAYADRIIRLVDGNVVEDFSYSEQKTELNVLEKEDSLTVRNGADLSDTEKDALAKAIKDKKRVQIIEALSFREKRKTGKIKRNTDNPEKLKKSRMKFKSTAMLGLKSLKVKPLRLIFTILLSAVAFAVFGLFDTIANFETSKVIAKQLKDYSSPTITARAVYLADKEQNDLYKIKLSEEKINEIASQTGYNVKGIYNFDENTKGETLWTYEIDELYGTSMPVGGEYFSKVFDGIIEFTEQETANGFVGNLGYSIYGKYPQKVAEGKINEVAISSYMAESIYQYAKSKNFWGIQSANELIDKTITVNAPYSKFVKGSVTFKIVGIIDCGTLPAKYDRLKTVSGSAVSDSALKKDFKAYLDSAPRRCLFVGEGFYDSLYNQNSNAVNYFGGNATWLVNNGASKNKPANSYVYNVADFTKENAMTFDGYYNKDGTITLQDNEVLVDLDNLGLLFNGISQGATNPTFTELKGALNSEILSFEQKQHKLKSYFQSASGDYSKTYQSITVEKKNDVSKQTITKTLKVVGIYFNVDTHVLLGSSQYGFMMNENLMKTFNISIDQGEYTRILFASRGTSRGRNVIANYMCADSGLSLIWYNNSVLDTISENEPMIRQSMDLFLYVSIALACFAVFMFFNYIGTSIVNKRQSIGVLRGLGARGKDILFMFLIESIVIALINAVLSAVITLVGCTFVNMYIMNVMNISISFAIFGVRQVLVLLGISVATAIASSILPIIKIAKEKPVSLIRKS